MLRQLDARSAAQNGSSASNLYAGIDLISAVLPFGQLWYEEASAAVDYAKHRTPNEHHREPPTFTRNWTFGSYYRRSYLPDYVAWENLDEWERLMGAATKR